MEVLKNKKMKKSTYMHVEMVDKNAKSYLAEQNTKLFKNLQMKPLKLTCVCFLYSIITPSILSIANSSFAFTAKVKDQEELNVYWIPVENNGNSNFRDIETTLPQNTQLDILYCRYSDLWCYLEGYKKRYLLKRWFKMQQICSYDLSIDFLESCTANKRKEIQNFIQQIKLQKAREIKLREYVCADQREPLYWFIDRESSCK